MSHNTKKKKKGNACKDASVWKRDFRKSQYSWPPSADKNNKLYRLSYSHAKKFNYSSYVLRFNARTTIRLSSIF